MSCAALTRRQALQCSAGALLSALVPSFRTAAAEPGCPSRLVCLGDSVTGVYYHTGGRRAYPEMLEIALSRLCLGTPVSVRNAGISGDTAERGLARLDRDVLRHKPELVTISFGLNDMVRAAPEAFRGSLEELVRRCRAAGSSVLLCTPNAVIDTANRPTARLVAFCDIIRAVGRDIGVPVCDQYAAGDAHRQADPWGWRLTMSDEIHPNMDGHRRMAAEIARAITGRAISLADIDPPFPILPRTGAALKRGERVGVLAMPPYDALAAPALSSRYPGANVEVTAWPTAGKTLGELEREAQALVRPRKPSLVIVAVPREAAAPDPESFVRAYTWVLNWSLSFGRQEWDCIAVHPSVASPGAAERDDLVRRIVRAQDLHIVDRAARNEEPADVLFSRWIAAVLSHA